MKVYVASSWRNNLQPKVVRQLRDGGHEVYDFRNPSKGFHWSEIDPDWQAWTPEKFKASLLHPLARGGYASDILGLQWCDAAVLVVPQTCGRSSHLELGYAIGAGKRSVILLSDGEPELMYGMADTICTSISGVLVALDGQGGESDG